MHIEIARADNIIVAAPHNNSAQPRSIPPLCNRVAQDQALILGFIAENSLPLSVTSGIIKLAQELAKDPKALAELSMDRTSASYKLTHGVKKTILDEALEEIRSVPFSLNIDEATSKTNKRVLESLFSALDRLFERMNLPWDNLVSILMDSCAVMRGSKNGLEKKIRDRRAPHLLDIDGDSCHHLHNASKKLCCPFERWVESLLSDLHTDHKCAILQKREVQETGRARIKELWKELGNRSKNFTNEGKMRKVRICKKSKDPKVHKLHDEQEKLVREFLSCFIKPEELINSKGRNLSGPKMKLLDLTSTEAHLAAPFVGSEASSPLDQLGREHPVVKAFKTKVESAFSVMSNILQAKAAKLSVETYESYQVVKYNLKAMQVSAIQHYSRKTKESPVNVQLCRNVKLSSQRYRALLRDKEELNKRPYNSEKPTAGKKMAKDAIVAAAVSARRKFQKKRVEALKKLATKAKESYKN
ncbi:splicing factor 3B subunit 2-like protein [Labeo rohita]|uniref:Splicing factor 3B subunit 2-like protein n=1 Tax=Labeo rohita TaxID=84645 RepID=A0A498NM45_LABRO|nr:splicing factor 3B subunit 2-like protein [Labeo rohita]